MSVDRNGLLSSEMEGLLERIGIAHTQVRRMHGEHRRLQLAVEAAEGLVHEAGREKEVLIARIKELEQENEVLRKAAVPIKAHGREEDRDKIDELVREIDQCLALMNG